VDFSRSQDLDFSSLFNVLDDSVQALITVLDSGIISNYFGDIPQSMFLGQESEDKGLFKVTKFQLKLKSSGVLLDISGKFLFRQPLSIKLGTLSLSAAINGIDFAEIKVDGIQFVKDQPDFHLRVQMVPVEGSAALGDILEQLTAGNIKDVDIGIRNVRIRTEHQGELPWMDKILSGLDMELPLEKLMSLFFSSSEPSKTSSSLAQMFNLKHVNVELKKQSQIEVIPDLEIVNGIDVDISVDPLQFSIASTKKNRYVTVSLPAIELNSLSKESFNKPLLIQLSEDPASSLDLGSDIEHFLEKRPFDLMISGIRIGEEEEREIGLNSILRFIDFPLPVKPSVSSTSLVSEPLLRVLIERGKLSTQDASIALDVDLQLALNLPLSGSIPYFGVTLGDRQDAFAQLQVHGLQVKSTDPAMHLRMDLSLTNDDQIAKRVITSFQAKQLVLSISSLGIGPSKDDVYPLFSKARLSIPLDKMGSSGSSSLIAVEVARSSDSLIGPIAIDAAGVSVERKSIVGSASIQYLNVLPFELDIGYIAIAVFIEKTEFCELELQNARIALGQQVLEPSLELHFENAKTSPETVKTLINSIMNKEAPFPQVSIAGLRFGASKANHIKFFQSLEIQIPLNGSGGSGLGLKLPSLSIKDLQFAGGALEVTESGAAFLKADISFMNQSPLSIKIPYVKADVRSLEKQLASVTISPLSMQQMASSSVGITLESDLNALIPLPSLSDLLLSGLVFGEPQDPIALFSLIELPLSRFTSGNGGGMPQLDFKQFLPKPTQLDVDIRDKAYVNAELLLPIRSPLAIKIPVLRAHVRAGDNKAGTITIDGITIDTSSTRLSIRGSLAFENEARSPGIEDAVAQVWRQEKELSLNSLEIGASFRLDLNIGIPLAFPSGPDDGSNKPSPFRFVKFMEASVKVISRQVDLKAVIMIINETILSVKCEHVMLDVLHKATKMLDIHLNNLMLARGESSIPVSALVRLDSAIIEHIGSILKGDPLQISGIQLGSVADPITILRKLVFEFTLPKGNGVPGGFMPSISALHVDVQKSGIRLAVAAEFKDPFPIALELPQIAASVSIGPLKLLTAFVEPLRLDQVTTKVQLRGSVVFESEQTSPGIEDAVVSVYEKQSQLRLSSVALGVGSDALVIPIDIPWPLGNGGSVPSVPIELKSLKNIELRFVPGGLEARVEAEVHNHSILAVKCQYLSGILTLGQIRLLRIALQDLILDRGLSQFQVNIRAYFWAKYISSILDQQLGLTGIEFGSAESPIGILRKLRFDIPNLTGNRASGSSLLSLEQVDLDVQDDFVRFGVGLNLGSEIPVSIIVPYAEAQLQVADLNAAQVTLNAVSLQERAAAVSVNGIVTFSNEATSPGLEDRVVELFDGRAAARVHTIAIGSSKEDSITLEVNFPIPITSQNNTDSQKFALRALTSIDIATVNQGVALSLQAQIWNPTIFAVRCAFIQGTLYDGSNDLLQVTARNLRVQRRESSLGLDLVLAFQERKLDLETLLRRKQFQFSNIIFGSEKSPITLFRKVVIPFTLPEGGLGTPGKMPSLNSALQRVSIVTQQDALESRVDIRLKSLFDALSLQVGYVKATLLVYGSEVGTATAENIDMSPNTDSLLHVLVQFPYNAPFTVGEKPFLALSKIAIGNDASTAIEASLGEFVLMQKLSLVENPSSEKKSMSDGFDLDSMHVHVTQNSLEFSISQLRLDLGFVLEVNIGALEAQIGIENESFGSIKTSNFILGQPNQNMVILSFKEATSKIPDILGNIATPYLAGQDVGPLLVSLRSLRIGPSKAQLHSILQHVELSTRFSLPKKNNGTSLALTPKIEYLNVNVVPQGVVAEIKGILKDFIVTMDIGRVEATLLLEDLNAATCILDNPKLESNGQFTVKALSSFGVMEPGVSKIIAGLLDFNPETSRTSARLGFTGLLFGPNEREFIHIFSKIRYSALVNFDKFFGSEKRSPEVPFTLKDIQIRSTEHGFEFAFNAKVSIPVTLSCDFLEAEIKSSTEGIGTLSAKDIRVKSADGTASASVQFAFYKTERTKQVLGDHLNPILRGNPSSVFVVGMRRILFGASKETAIGILEDAETQIFKVPAIIRDPDGRQKKSFEVERVALAAANGGVEVELTFALRHGISFDIDIDVGYISGQLDLDQKKFARIYTQNTHLLSRNGEIEADVHFSVDLRDGAESGDKLSEIVNALLQGKQVPETRVGFLNFIAGMSETQNFDALSKLSFESSLQVKPGDGSGNGYKVENIKVEKLDIRTEGSQLRGAGIVRVTPPPPFKFHVADVAFDIIMNTVKIAEIRITSVDVESDLIEVDCSIDFVGGLLLGPPALEAYLTQHAFPAVSIANIRFKDNSTSAFSKLDYPIPLDLFKSSMDGMKERPASEHVPFLSYLDGDFRLSDTGFDLELDFALKDTLPLNFYVGNFEIGVFLSDLNSPFIVKDRIATLSASQLRVSRKREKKQVISLKFNKPEILRYLTDRLLDKKSFPVSLSALQFGASATEKNQNFKNLVFPLGSLLQSNSKGVAPIAFTSPAWDWTNGKPFLDPRFRFKVVNNLPIRLHFGTLYAYVHLLGNRIARGTTDLLEIENGTHQVNIRFEGNWFEAAWPLMQSIIKHNGWKGILKELSARQWWAEKKNTNVPVPWTAAGFREFELFIGRFFKDIGPPDDRVLKSLEGKNPIEPTDTKNSTLEQSPQETTVAKESTTASEDPSEIIAPPVSTSAPASPAQPSQSEAILVSH